jgi:Fe-S-cluster containining protein
VSDNTLPWFSNGLRFKCTECGKCCTGTPGYVWLSASDMEEMALYLKISVADFKKRYTRLVLGRHCLTERAVTYDCVFLKDKKCQVYGARPKQCRTYPWWIQNIKSEEAWRSASEQCEGINHPDAPLISRAEIEKQLDTDL